MRTRCDAIGSTVLFSAISFTFFSLIAPEVGAQTCGTRVCTESEICLAGDGVLADAGGLDGCGLYFSGSFGRIGNSALEEYGGFEVGTRVHVEGCAVPYFGPCSLFWSIRANTIKETNPPAVPTLGRSGQVLAILLMLGIGSLAIWFSRNWMLHRPTR